jgi:DNA-binding IclR family transcriptional regulator
MLKPKGCRSGELKQKLGIGDASLHRLLHNLVELQWIQSNKRGHYKLGPQATALMQKMIANPIQGEMNSILEDLSSRTQQSSAWCSLENGQMICKATHQMRESIVLMPIGARLHAECDHAAALAILDQCEPEIQKEMILSEGSTFESTSHLNKAILTAKQSAQKGLTNAHDAQKKSVPNIYLDISQQRRGVSRCAIAFEMNKHLHAIFLCGTTISIRSKHRYNRDCLLDTFKKISIKL